MATWTGAVNSRWGNAGNWDTGTVPNAAGASALFSGTTAGIQDIFLLGNAYTVGQISLSSSAGGGFHFQNGRIIFDNGANDALLTVATDNASADFAAGITFQLNSNLLLPYAGPVGTHHITFAGNITGVGGLTVASYVDLTLSGSADYFGDTSIQAFNHIDLMQGNALSANSVVYFHNNDSTIDLHGFGQTIHGLRSDQASNRVINTGGSVTLEISNGLNEFSSFAGSIEEAAGSGRLDLFKSGDGTLALDGTSNRTGHTTISGGKLVSTVSALGSGTIDLVGGRLDVSNQGTLDNDFNIGTSSRIVGNFTLAGFIDVAALNATLWFGRPPSEFALVGTITFAPSQVGNPAASIYLQSNQRLLLGNMHAADFLAGATDVFDIGSGSALRLNHLSLTLNHLSGGGEITFAGGETLTVLNAGSGFSGRLHDENFQGAQVALNGNVVDISAVTFGNWNQAVDFITINGTSANDSLTGSIKDDMLAGGLGADALNGGGGIDTASYASNGAAVSVYLKSNLADEGGGINDTLSGIENVIGSAFNDLIEGDVNANLIDGGNGSDTAYYYTSAAGVAVSLLANTGSGGDAAGDRYVSIENISGSNVGGDVLTGSAAANKLYGNGGADTLDGGAGVDQLFGGNGDDTILFDAADDLANVLGGADYDTLRVVSQPVPTAFDLTAHQFERANVLSTDTAGAWWSSTSDYYNTSWQRTNADIFADDGRLVQTTYDVSPGGTGQNWQFITDYRNPAGVLTNQDGKFDIGMLFSKSFDYAAGTGTDGISDELREFTYFFRNDSEKAANMVANVEGFYDDGRKFTQTNDVDANQLWSFQTNWYKTDGVTLDFLEIHWDDGHTTITPY